MLFKLSLRNIHRSLRDYAIYFFTLIIGVAVFYVFNAVGGQAAMMKVNENRSDIVELLTTTLSVISVFVAGVLGLLIVYASRFLMKRRNKEFALYLTLGMRKGQVSAILLIETMLIGLGSLAVGLVLGIGISQLMSALVANLFEADMTAYKFNVSGEAVGKTILYFAMMYLVVMLFHSLIVSRFRLIDLMQSGKKAEPVMLKNPVLCVIIFVAAAVLLGIAYYQVCWNYNELNQNKLFAYIAAGAVSTFLIFWSVSGMLLRVVMSMKNVYYRSLNSFTFRQISSKVNTMVFSMTVICLMLFVTICTLSSAFSIRSSMNANLNSQCPADCELCCQEFADEDWNKTFPVDITEVYKKHDCDITENFSEYVHFHTYKDRNFTLDAFLGEQSEEMHKQFPYLTYDESFDLVTLSDYNALMQLYGRESLSMDEGEFILLCDFKSAKKILDKILETEKEITVFGHTLKSRYGECQDGFIDISSQHINAGILVIPDSAAEEAYAYTDYLIGNYKGDKEETEQLVEDMYWAVKDSIAMAQNNDTFQSEVNIGMNTRLDIAEASIGLGAIITFIGLYIGLVFLIACGAILALKAISDSVDSINRYEMLRKIGAEESDISKSLFRQTGIFFLLPLLLACVHSVFGMKFAIYFLETFGTEKIAESVAFTSVIILLIYGGYFLITYFCGKGIIKERK